MILSLNKTCKNVLLLKGIEEHALKNVSNPLKGINWMNLLEIANTTLYDPPLRYMLGRYILRVKRNDFLANIWCTVAFNQHIILLFLKITSLALQSEKCSLAFLAMQPVPIRQKNTSHFCVTLLQSKPSVVVLSSYSPCCPSWCKYWGFGPLKQQK